jgi:hypothetical protein
MMDNPPWYDAARRYIVNDFQWFVESGNFLNVREQGGYIGIHSGGHTPAAIFSFRHHTGAWNVGPDQCLDGAHRHWPRRRCHRCRARQPQKPHGSSAMLGGQQQIHRDDMPASEGLMTQEVISKRATP